MKGVAKKSAVWMLLLISVNELWSQNETGDLHMSVRNMPLVTGRSVLFKPLLQASQPALTAPYDMAAISKKLRTNRRLIISGAVLTGAGGAFLAAGFGLIYSPLGGRGGGGDFGLLILLTPGIGVTAAGIPLLAVGLTGRHKWQKRKDQLNIQTGVLANGHIGFAMAF